MTKLSTGYLFNGAISTAEALISYEVQPVKGGEGGKKWSSHILRHHLGRADLWN